MYFSNFAVYSKQFFCWFRISSIQTVEKSCPYHMLTRLFHWLISTRAITKRNVQLLTSLILFQKRNDHLYLDRVWLDDRGTSSLNSQVHFWYGEPDKNWSNNYLKTILKTECRDLVIVWIWWAISLNDKSTELGHTGKRNRTISCIDKNYSPYDKNAINNNFTSVATGWFILILVWRTYMKK